MQISEYVSSGNLYSDWNAFEFYVNKIFKKVIPEELAEDEFIHAYLTKDGDYNAFMTPSGKAFIHIGLFDEVFDEATIAGILAHELAHYYFDHSLKGFIKAERGEFKTSVFRKKKSAGRFSIQNELQADSLAMHWMLQSGYSLDGLTDAFQIGERIEKNTLMRLESIWELKETTHPISADRLKLIKEFKLKHKDTKGESFLVSKEKFKKFTDASKAEILSHLLRDFSYSLCIEKAFKYHIYDPENKIYVYYLMESIRRRCYLNPDIWRKNFITDRYFREVKGKDLKRKVKMENHLFEKFPLQILRINPKTARLIQARFYWDEEPKFTTYEEAFRFFAQVGTLYEIDECILSNALSVTGNKEVRNGLLKEYLSKEKIRYRDFAENLLNDKIQSGLPDKKMTVLGNIQCIVRQGKEEVYIRDEASGNDEQLFELFRNAMYHFPERKNLISDDLKKDNLSDYRILGEMERFSFMTILSKGEKTELHILDPSFWEFMNKYQVNEIEYVNCVYSDIRKADFSLEGYQSLISHDYSSFLEEVKRSRYIDIVITCLREIDKKSMKFRHYNGEEKLNFKEPGRDQFINLIIQKIKNKDKVAEG